MRYKIGLSIFIAFISMAAFTYGVAFSKQIGKGIPAEWWLVNTIEYKDLVAKNHPGRRIMVVSGSNSLFSINSDTIKNETGIQTINMAMHAGLDLDFYKYIINKYTHKGDIIVIPLEYEFYTRQNPYDEWFVDNMSLWGTDYLKSISYYSALKLISYLSPKRIYEAIITNEPKKYDDISIVKEFYENNDGRFYGYNFRSMNLNGDINANPKMTKQQNDEKHKVHQCINENTQVSNYSIEKIKQIQDSVIKLGATMILTFPMHARDSQCTMSNPITVNALKKIERSLQKNSIKIYCNPGLSMISPEFFIEPPYHANAIGAQIRSEFLGKCINEIITTGDDKLSINTPLSALTSLELKNIHLVNE